MKRYLSLLCILTLIAVLLAGCGQQGNEETVASADEQMQAEAVGLEMHKIGIATYNIKDAQVMMFKDYLDNYIRSCFVDVTFLYSDSITSADEMMDFLALCKENGCEGIMSFNTQDLQREVEYCASQSMYYIRPSSNSSDVDFEAVANNPYYLGEIGPGSRLEEEACISMVRALAEKDDGNRYLILSGGAGMGIEMHRQRTVAMLNTLQEVYDVTFETSVEELAVSAQPTEASAGALTIAIYPGFIDLPNFGDPASEAILTGNYDVILSTVAVTPLMDALSATNITCGTTDCFSEDNYFGFKKGKVSFVAGKFQSEIGPAFAALYNAITGNAEAFRDNGRAFRLEQGYWMASDTEEYDSRYALACGAAINAYNYEDLYSVIVSLTPEATFEDLKALTGSFSYEDCLARRAE